ncbi:helix-turn-helix domain-containing protein [Amycolatopsis sp. NBC_00345]|uniref:helix-turn-helix domain-containing protein n=1 Tax=Amycolatopsis sp. NBC_00345 TaxID=2975955 RepID=UPI002E2660A0
MPPARADFEMGTTMDLDHPASSAGARSLCADALERLRRQAVAAVESGLTQSHTARQFGVSRKAVGKWVRAYHAEGEEAFRPRRRGRRAGERLALSPADQAWIVKTLAGGPPDEAGVPSLLWTRRAVAELVRRQFGISLSGSTIDQYLERWELFDRAAAAAHPRRSETLLLGWVRPLPPGAAERVNALVAVTSRGMLFFLASEQPFTADQLTQFRHRLRVQLAADVGLLVYSWPPMYREALARWQLDTPDIVAR